MDNNDEAGKNVFSPQVVGVRAVQVIEGRSENPNAGIKTGIESVDSILNPHRPGELRVVLGYTSNYKSGFMNYVSRYNAKSIKERQEEGKAVITVTWEQSVEEQGITDLAQISVLDVTKMMRGELTDSDWKKLRAAAVKRGLLPWWLIGHSSEDNRRRPRLDLTTLASAIAYVVDVQKIQPELISLDYLQRIKREGDNDRIREQFMEIVDRCKDMALAFHCPVMLGSQAGRKVKERIWKLPQAEDGQETSNLEQSADSLISLWMPKNDNPLGSMISYGETSYIVTDNLLIMGIQKQKFGPAPRIIPLHVKPEVNEIYDVETVKFDERTGNNGYHKAYRD
jgi:replicative DNA helicase